MHKMRSRPSPTRRFNQYGLPVSARIDKVHRQDFQALRIDFTGVDPSQADNLTPEEIEERVRLEERASA